MLVIVINAITCNSLTKSIVRNSLCLEFNGKIDHIELNPGRKKLRYVIVNGSDCFIQNPIILQFSIGDRIIKRKGSMQYMWVTQTGDTTLFYKQVRGEAGKSIDITDEDIGDEKCE
ncbi:MAG: hypothetical protein RL660_3046 [Bacteroidota bacterium]|jgi:hypothetical protein